MQTSKLKHSVGLICLMVFLAANLIGCSEDEGGNEPRIPVVLSFSPESGEPGDNVTITGTDLDGATAVTIGDAEATIVSNSSTEVVATVPEGASTGKVSVRTEGGLGQSTNDFTVIVVGAVSVSAVSPVSGQVGDNITITGTDMATVSSLKVGDVEATIVGTTAETVEFTIPDGAEVGASTLTIVNEGGTTTTSTDAVAFYVFKTNADLIMTFDGEQTGIFTGSPDPEESTIYGTSDDATVQSEAQALPTAIDGNFFQFEGYSTADISGNYATIVQNSSALPAGTYAEFLAGASENDIYFNIQIHVGELPADYDDALFGLRIRFDGDDYEFVPTPTELTDLGFSPDENGWWNLSIPAALFDDDAALGTFAFTDMQRIGVAVRRNYGSGGTAGAQVTEADGGVFYSQSIDNVILTVGGPYSY
ncbi:IPT/TIG domain-containing protein [Marinoscillum sp.]|uniref:IPT/TIG domain-containing protein n=1 Tax=Marinoscillum sp. TaxID=2024838 RepID=UPI003BA97482